jgi:hypothetical protein
MARFAGLWLLLSVSPLLGGCRASASASVNTGKNEEPADFDTPLEGPMSEEAPAEQASEKALLGARHDLRLSPERKTATCQCVAVALGPPQDAGMAWESQPPQIDPQTQLVVALSSEGVSCDAPPKDGLGASYWGYRRVGDDVVVVLEVARFGRPITTGAIIPKPTANGQVYVQPLTKDVPYGRSMAAGEKLCRLGNPGPATARTPPSGSKTVEENADFDD